MKTTDNTASGKVKQGRRPMFKPFEKQIEELQQELVNEAIKHTTTMKQRDTLQTELGNTQFALEEMAAQRDTALAALRKIADLGEQYGAMVARAAIAAAEKGS